MTYRNTRFHSQMACGFILIAIDLDILGCGQQILSPSTHTESQMHVTLKDFTVSPNHTTAKAGWITFQAVIAGTMPYELVIIRTDLNPATLPRIQEKGYKGTVTGHIVHEGHITV